VFSIKNQSAIKKKPLKYGVKYRFIFLEKINGLKIDQKQVITFLLLLECARLKLCNT
jgi:hypothetical protein